MASINDKYFQDYKSRLEKQSAETAHDFHIIEFEQMCQEMITKALAAHDEQIQIDVQTTLNGKPLTMISIGNRGMKARGEKDVLS